MYIIYIYLRAARELPRYCSVYRSNDTNVSIVIQRNWVSVPAFTTKSTEFRAIYLSAVQADLNICIYMYRHKFEFLLPLSYLKFGYFYRLTILSFVISISLNYRSFFCQSLPQGVTCIYFFFRCFCYLSLSLSLSLI